MAQTIYATFPDPALAEKAAGALLDHGARNEDISLVSREYREDERRDDNNEAARGESVAHSATFAESRTDAAYGSTPGTPSTDRDSYGNRVAEAGDRTMATASGAVGADNTARNYQAAADQRAYNPNMPAQPANTGFVPEPMGATAAKDAYSVPVRHPGDVDTTYATDAVDTNQPVVEDTYTGTTDYATDDEVAATDGPRDSNTTYINHTTGQGDKSELAAKQGLSTTTPGDAGMGAAKGAGWGLGVGILAGLASIFVPPIGLVAGGGALATAIAAMAATTAAGAIAGGVHGYLVDQGVPEHVATSINQAYERGHAVLSVTVPSGELDEMSAREILEKYGAENLAPYGVDAMAA